MATIAEMTNSRPGKVSIEETSGTRIFKVRGTMDDAAVRTLVEATIPATHNGAPLQSYDIDPVGWNTWEVKANYGKIEPRSLGEITLQGDASQGTIHLTQALATTGQYGLAADGGDFPDYKDAIGVNGTKVEGVDVPSPSLNFTVGVKVDATLLASNFIVTCYKMRGKVNDATFTVTWKGQILVFAKGELRYLGIRFQDDGPDRIDFSHMFEASENRTDITIGEMEDIPKEGWEYLWVMYTDSVDADTFGETARHVFVQRVTEYANFSVLGI